MPQFTKVMIIGNITRDPMLVQEEGKLPKLDIGVEMTKVKQTESGNEIETAFIDCRAIGRAAMELQKFAKKGRPLFIEGRLDFEAWTDGEGVKHTKHRIIIETYQFIPTPCRCGGACKCKDEVKV